MRLHYAETLTQQREWFLALHAEAMELYDERFPGLWESCLAVSEMAFRHQGMMVFQLQVRSAKMRSRSRVPISEPKGRGHGRMNLAGANAMPSRRSPIPVLRNERRAAIDCRWKLPSGTGIENAPGSA